MNTVVTEIEFPSSMPVAARSQGQLHVGVKLTDESLGTNVTCTPLDPAVPSSAPGNLTATERGYLLTQQRIGGVPPFCAAAWFDANNNGKVDSGDAAGHLATPYPRQRSTSYATDRYTSPPVVLALIP